MNSQLSDELRNKALEFLTNNFIPVNEKIKKVGWWLVVAGLICAVAGFFILKAKTVSNQSDNTGSHESTTENI
jgi:type II secretory pathway component PulF